MVMLVRCACGVIAISRADLPTPCQTHGESSVVEYVPASEVTRLLREARSMIPHADVSSDERADWCARADKLAFDDQEAR